MGDASTTWVWAESKAPIDYSSGDLVWPADTFTVNTGNQPFIKTGKKGFTIENKKITNLGTGAIIETYGDGYVNITNSNFISEGGVLKLYGGAQNKKRSTITGGSFTSTGSSGIVIGGYVSISGAMVSGGSTGVEINNASNGENVKIENTTIQNTGIGVHIPVGAVTISGTSSISCTGTGVAITGGNGSWATLNGCRVTSSGGAGVAIETKQGTGCTVTLNGCTVNAVNMATLKGTSNGRAKLVLGSNNNVTSTKADILLWVGNRDYQEEVETSNYNNGNKKWTVDVDYTGTGAMPFGGVGVCQYTTPYDAHCIIYKNESTVHEEWNRTYIDRHKHWWKLDYTGTGNTRSYYVECERSIEGKCKYRSHDSSQNVEITVPTTYVYTGNPVSIPLNSQQVKAINALGLGIEFEYYDSSNAKLQSAPSEIGKYQVRPVIKSNNGTDEVESSSNDTIEFSIVPSVEARTELVYTGQPQNLVTSGTLPTGTKVYYKLSTESTYGTTIPTGTNAGEYTVQYYMANDSGNIYGTPENPITLTVSIAKATPKLTFDTLTHEYNGKVFAPTVTADTDEVTKITVTCRDMQGKYVGPRNAGTYTVETTSLETTNYKSATTEGSLKINPKEVGVTWSNLELVYNGNFQGPTATINQQDLAEGDRTLSLAVTEKQNAGTYTAQANVQNNENYRISTETRQQEFVIKPKEVTIVWGEGDFTYTGSAQAPTAAVQAADLIGSDTTSITVTGQQTGASDTPYTATAALGNSNYTPANPTKEFTIEKFTPTLSNVKASIPANTKDIAEVTVTGSWNAPSALGSLPGKLEPKAGQTLTWGENGLNYITCVFTPTDTTNIAEVEVENVPVQLADHVSPDVAVTLNGGSWESDQYLNTDAQVTITVTDAVSGVKTARYAVVWEGKSLSSSDWKTIPESGTVTVTVPAEHGKKFYVNVSTYDNCDNGNTRGSNHVTFLTEPPVIDLDASKTYYVTTKFSVSGLMIDSVTRKNSTSGVTDPIGSTASDDFLLPGNTNTTYTVTATDKAGNVTTVTVTMKPIASIMEPLTGVTVSNVTTDNEETVKSIESLRKELYNTKGVTTSETVELDNISVLLNELQRRIDTVKNRYNKALKYDSITPETVTWNGWDGLQAAGGVEAVIDNFVGDYGGNLTGDQKTKLAEIRKNLQDSFALINQVINLEAEINALPNSVEPDDVDAVTSVRDVRSALASLSDHAQEILDSMCKAKLDALWTQATTYKIIKGDGKVWVRSEGDYEVIANGPFVWFTQLLIDGETVEPDSYTAASGSTVVTLPKAYMDKLKDGKHTVVFVYENDGPLGQAEGTFTVQTPSGGSPHTGDENNMLPYGIAIVAALAALAVLFVPKKRKKQ